MYAKLLILLILVPLLVTVVSSGAVNIISHEGVGFYTSNIYPFLPRVDCPTPWCSIQGGEIDGYGLYHSIHLNLVVPLGKVYVYDVVGFANLRNKPVNIYVYLNYTDLVSNITVLIRSNNNTVLVLTKNKPFGTFTLDPKTGVTISFVFESYEVGREEFDLLFMEL